MEIVPFMEDLGLYQCWPDIKVIWACFFERLHPYRDSEAVSEKQHDILVSQCSEYGTKLKVPVGLKFSNLTFPVL